MDKKTQAAMFSSANGDHRTPIWLFELLDREFALNVDAAADNESSLCPLYLADALHDSWMIPAKLNKGIAAPSRVYMNPPYGRGIGEWTRRALKAFADEEAELVVMLLPARTDAAWWRHAALCATEIRLIKGRLKFGDSKNSAPFPSCVMILAAYGQARPSRLPAISVRMWEPK